MNESSDQQMDGHKTDLRESLGGLDWTDTIKTLEHNGSLNVFFLAFFNSPSCYMLVHTDTPW